MKQFGSFKCILGGAVTELPLIQPLCPKHRYANHQPIHTSFNMHFIMILPFTAFALISRQFSAVFQDTFSLFMQHVIPWFFPISLIWWPPLSRGTYFQRNGILPYTWPICFFSSFKNHARPVFSSYNCPTWCKKCRDNVDTWEKKRMKRKKEKRIFLTK